MPARRRSPAPPSKSCRIRAAAAPATPATATAPAALAKPRACLTCSPGSARWRIVRESLMPRPGNRQRPHDGRRRHAQHGAVYRPPASAPRGRWPGDAAAAVEAGQEFPSFISIRPGAAPANTTLPSCSRSRPCRRRTGTARFRARPPVVLNPPHNALLSQLSELAAKPMQRAHRAPVHLGLPRLVQPGTRLLLRPVTGRPRNGRRPRTGTPPEPDPRRSAGRHARIAPREMRHNAPRADCHQARNPPTMTS